MEAIDIELRNSFLACLGRNEVDFFLSALHEFLDACWMNATVFYEGLESRTRHLPADWIK